MKITIIDCPEGEEEEIIIKCRQMDEHLMRMIRTVKAGQERLIGTRNGQIMQIQPKEIYYFEAVDNRVFLYGEREVFETRYKLYELEERLGGNGFFPGVQIRTAEPFQSEKLCHGSWRQV